MNILLHECFTNYARLRQEMDGWSKHCIENGRSGPHGGGQDEANYSLSLLHHYLVDGSSALLSHFAELRKDLSRWVHQECIHGYEPYADVHHGSEPFLLFLPRYIGLASHDSDAVHLLCDAAEHIGNWVKDIPPWYNYARDVFHGYYLGTRSVGKACTMLYEVAEHIRFIHIALAAYRISHEQRYLDWSVRYGLKWARRIAEAEFPFPLLWDLSGRGLYESEVREKNLGRLAVLAHHFPGDPLSGLDNLIASGAIYALGDLYCLTAEEIFSKAAESLIRPLIDIFNDPYGDPGAAAISYFRRTFCCTKLDLLLRAKIAEMPEGTPGKLELILPENHVRLDPGIGRRSDMVRWGECSPYGEVVLTREPSTAALVLAYQLTGELTFAARAFRSAADKIKLARAALLSGRDHADAGNTVSAVASGHGRNWGHGAVTGCYGPLLLGTYEKLSEVLQVIKVRREDNTPGLPSNLLTLIRQGIDKSNEGIFYNGSSETLECRWQAQTSEKFAWKKLCLAPGQELRIDFSSGAL